MAVYSAARCIISSEKRSQNGSRSLKSEQIFFPQAFCHANSKTQKVTESIFFIIFNCIFEVNAVFKLSAVDFL